MNVNSKGFSLVELLIVMALSGVALVGMGSLLNLSTRFDRNSSMNADNHELASIVRQLVNNPKSCSPNLEGKTLNVATRAPTSVDDISFMASTANPDVLTKSAPVLKTAGGAKSFGKLNVDGIDIVPDVELTSDVWIAKIQINTQKTGQSMGALQSRMEIPVRVKIDPSSGEILSCTGLSESSVLTEDAPLNDKICKLVSNGVASYDPVTNKCIGLPPLPTETIAAEEPVDTKGKDKITDEDCKAASGGKMTLDPVTGYCDYVKIQVKGTKTECQCPSGYRMTNCKGTGPYFDSKSGNKCYYTEDGDKHCAGVQECKQDKVNQSGRCSYDTTQGVDFTDALCRCDCVPQ